MSEGNTRGGAKELREGPLFESGSNPEPRSKSLAPLASLMAEECPACRAEKHARETLCRRCYYKLPAEMRRALYKRYGEGYEEAVAAALAFLSPGPRPEAA